MEKYSFFNSVNKDRVYLAEDFAEYFASFIGTGVYANPADNLQVMSNNNMNITVKAGKAWINGYFYQNTSSLALQLQNASGTLNRIDSIVVRCDFAGRKMQTIVKTGTPSNAPVTPPLIRNSDIYEIQLAEVYVKSGSGFVSQANITDTRMNNSVCGFVSGVVDQIDTEGLFAQYDDAFQYWFNNVKGTLSGDVAGNLSNKIDGHIQNTNMHVTEEEKEKWNNTIINLSYSKYDSIHRLVGLNQTAGIFTVTFKPSSNFVSGDSITIDGTQYAIKMSNGEPAETNLFAGNTVISAIADVAHKTINFKSGGGLSNTQLSLATATIAQVMQGFTFFAGDKNLKTGTYKPLKYATGKVQTKNAGTYDGDKWAWASGFDFKPFLVVIVDKWRKGDYQGIETNITVVAACINAEGMNDTIGNIGGYAEWDDYHLPDGEKMRMTASYGQFQIFLDDGGSIYACSDQAQYFAVGY